ncbi:MAG: hypothetical protein M3Q58_05975 [Bacteroidota bacterium]|nr:hypothetical protein [Bacteroidota bacterium]
MVKSSCQNLPFIFTMTEEGIALAKIQTIKVEVGQESVERNIQETHSLSLSIILEIVLNVAGEKKVEVQDNLSYSISNFSNSNGIGFTFLVC